MMATEPRRPATPRERKPPPEGKAFGLPEPKSAQEALGLLLQELTSEKKSSKRSSYGLGTIGGALLAVILYYGQSQTERLDKVVEGVQQVRIEVTTLSARVDNVEKIRGELAVLRADLEAHKQEPSHGIAGQDMKVVQQRLDDIVKRLDRFGDGR